MEEEPILFPPSRTDLLVLMAKEEHGLSITLKKTPEQCFYLIMEDKTPNLLFMADLMILQPTHHYTGTQRIWFCGPDRPKERLKRLLDSILPLFQNPPQATETAVPEVPFPKLMYGKALPPLAQGLEVAKQNDKSVAVHGEAVDKHADLLNRYGKKHKRTCAGEGWLLTFENYCALRKHFGHH